MNEAKKINLVRALMRLEPVLTDPDAPAANEGLRLALLEATKGGRRGRVKKEDRSHRKRTSEPQADGLGEALRVEQLPAPEESVQFVRKTLQVLDSLHRRSSRLTRHQLMQSLQTYLRAQEGKSFGPWANKLLENALNEFLRAHGLRLMCLKKSCGEPSLLRYTSTGTGHEGHQFLTEHRNEAGKQCRHGGPTAIPRLDIVAVPFQPQLVLDEIRRQ